MRELEDRTQDLMNSEALLERSEAEKVSDSHLIETLSHKLKSLSEEYNTVKSELAIHTGGDDNSDDSGDDSASNFEDF